MNRPLIRPLLCASARVAGPGALICVLSLFALASCGSTRRLSTDETELVAWFIEDVAHGHTRRGEELDVVHPTSAMTRIITWMHPVQNQHFLANGELAHQDYVPPSSLLARLIRWPTLRELFLSQVVVVLPSGLVAVRPGASNELAAAAFPVIDAENLDRRELDAMVITTGNLQDEAQSYYLEQSALARVNLDRQGGAQLWEAKDHPPAH